MNAQTKPTFPIWYGIQRDDMTRAQLAQYIEDQKAISASNWREANGTYGTWQDRKRCHWHDETIKSAEYWLFILEAGDFNSIKEARAAAPQI